jgi:D-threo-aldose 1-dehydrogenase
LSILATNDVLSRIGFGTGSLHHITSLKARIRLLHLAMDFGIVHFDSAPYYGYGLAELTLGSALSHVRDRVTITTKVGLYPPLYCSTSTSLKVVKAVGKLIAPLSRPLVDWSIDQANKSLTASLSRMKTNYVDYLFLHEPQISLIDTHEVLKWLENLKKNGSIRSWGIAGLRDRLEPFLAANSALADWIQTKDSNLEQEANFIKQYGRELQFTYGYLSSKSRNSKAKVELIAAINRNREGTVLISTRSEEHLKQLFDEF